MPGCGVHLYCFIDSLVYCFSNYQLARNSPIEPRDEMECNKKQGAEALYLSWYEVASENVRGLRLAMLLWPSCNTVSTLLMTSGGGGDSLIGVKNYKSPVTRDKVSTWPHFIVPALPSGPQPPATSRRLPSNHGDIAFSGGHRCTDIYSLQISTDIYRYLLPSAAFFTRYSVMEESGTLLGWGGKSTNKHSSCSLNTKCSKQLSWINSFTQWTFMGSFCVFV